MTGVPVTVLVARWLGAGVIARATPRRWCPVAALANSQIGVVWSNISHNRWAGLPLAIIIGAAIKGDVMKNTVKFFAVCVAAPVMALGVAAPTAWANGAIHSHNNIVGVDSSHNDIVGVDSSHNNIVGREAVLDPRLGPAPAQRGPIRGPIVDIDPPPPAEHHIGIP
jgi:hypothetical protein